MAQELLLLTDCTSGRGRSECIRGRIGTPLLSPINSSSRNSGTLEKSSSMFLALHLGTLGQSLSRTHRSIDALLFDSIWRAPFGDVDDRIRFIAASLNLATVGWSDDTFDYKVASMTNPQGLPIPSVVANYQAIAGNSTSQAELQRIGNIVLTHELNNVSMLVAVQQLPSLFGKFKHVMPVSSCMNVSHPYDEQSWTYALFNDYVAGNNATNNGSQALDTSIAAYTGGSATSLSPGATTLASSEVVGSVVTSTNIVAFPTAATGAASPAFVIQSGFAMGIAAVSGLLLIATV